MSNLPAEFSDLDYPGKKKPVNRGPQKKTVTIEVASWDSRPVHYLIPQGDGTSQNREFFTIKALATALSYSVQSIRAWEASGLMPKTPFRSPRTRGMVAGGRSDKGRRLWTRTQIEEVLRLAQKHNVLLNREPPTRAFSQDVSQAFGVEYDRVVGDKQSV